MNGFEKRKQRKKQNILNAALQLFTDFGVQKVSIQEIAQKAQVSQVTIYNYFGSKDQLLYDTVHMFIHQRLEKFETIVDHQSMDFKDKIQQLITDKKEDLLHINTDFLQSVLADQPEIQELLTTFTENHTKPLLLKLMEQGRTTGYIHPDLSIETILFYVEMYFQAFQAMSDRTQQTNPHFGEELLHLFFYGMMGNKDEPMH